MYKISKLNHHNTNSLNLIPGMTAIRFDDGLATTAHRYYIPQTFNMRCVIPFHPSITNFCTHGTCKSSYSGKAPSPNHPTDDILIILNLIKGRRFGWPRQNISSISLQKAQSRVLRYEKSHHLASDTYPCDVTVLQISETVLQCSDTFGFQLTCVVRTLTCVVRTLNRVLRHS